MITPASSSIPNFGSGALKSAARMQDMFSAPAQRRIALVSTFTPRRCGIATFAGDTVDKLRTFQPRVEVDVYALDEGAQQVAYEPGTRVIDAADPASYADAARQINASGVGAVWLQHEYGIFGGDDGAMVRDFVDRLAPPLILTAHTVLGEPRENQHEILAHLVARSSRVMVMSRHARDLLATCYGAPHSILRVIEHGAPNRPFGRQAEFKRRLGLEDRNVLTTFGLLGPGKGIERAIEALPAIVARHPATIYRIVGATHPKLAEREGEAYRHKLEELATGLGVADHIAWENRFLDTDELLDQLEACDIYLTPYPGLQQSTSGTLSYAVALGKAVVSTPYLHARELLADGVGRLIEPGSSTAIAANVNELLDDPDELAAQQRRAYDKGRETIWPRFAEAAARLIDEAVVPRTAAHRPAEAPALDAVFAMSDATGILQHAIGIVPDREHGYCLDDNARALMLVNVAENLPPPERTARSLTYAAFIQHAWHEEAGGFRNFLRYERTWCETRGSEDSNGRALWALGQTLARAPAADLRDWAERWFDKALPHCARFRSPRAAAFAMLGAAHSLSARPDHGASRDLLEAGGAFLLRLLREARRLSWAWFEPALAYDNPRLPQALIEAGAALDRAAFTRAGLEVLEWLTDRQTSAEGQFRAIGSDSFGCATETLPFDQQPLEAQAAIEAAMLAHAITGEGHWRDHALAAWNWFFGANDRGAVLADLATGRCRDGLNPRGANVNCGAESILAFHLSYYSLIGSPRALAGESKGEGLGRPRAGTGRLLEYS